MPDAPADGQFVAPDTPAGLPRSEEHTSELQSQSNLVCRLLLAKKNTITMSVRASPWSAQPFRQAVIGLPDKPPVGALIAGGMGGMLGAVTSFDAPGMYARPHLR